VQRVVLFFSYPFPYSSTVFRALCSKVVGLWHESLQLSDPAEH